MKKYTNEDFLKKANEVHNWKYKYNNDYKNSKSKLKIICPIHGEFEQNARSHLAGRGCPECGKIRGIKKRSLTNEEFIEKAKKIHKNKNYSYDEVNYINNYTHVTIICPKHGRFIQRPMEHLEGNGCQKCANESMKKKLSMTNEEFIERSRKIHGDTYDYSKVKYINTETHVSIICKEHGIFIQTPHNHLTGCGCPYCRESKIEHLTKVFLEDKGIGFEQQKRFKWLKKQSLDFYIPEYKIAIECQGGQHFFPVDFSGEGIEKSKEKLVTIIKLDESKFENCLKHGVRIIYFTDIPFEYEEVSWIYVDNIFNDLEKLIKVLNNNGKE